ncbi:Uncharacterised protein [Enterobacter cloacae]|uniref:Uncharacterized protein n=1 Tax=Enterobacter cloacae TaxID=550 RepID=A0A377LNM5_ENTCL|nr:Uncharacterised protein [Enterobacter cloacae]
MTSSVPPLSSRDRYRLMLQTFPLLANYWNTDDDCLRYDELKEAIGVLSRGRANHGPVLLVGLDRGESRL